MSVKKVIFKANFLCYVCCSSYFVLPTRRLETRYIYLSIPNCELNSYMNSYIDSTQCVVPRHSARRHGMNLDTFFHFRFMLLWVFQKDFFHNWIVFHFQRMIISYPLRLHHVITLLISDRMHITKSTPRSVPQKKVFLFTIDLATTFWKWSYSYKNFRNTF